MLVVGFAAAAAVALVDTAKIRALAVTVAMAVLLIAPGAWAFQTLGHATTGNAGGGFAGGGPFGGDTQSLSAAVAYAEAHGGGTIAVSSQSGAAGELIADQADIAALGGFSGRESQVSVEWLADAVEQGRLRWVSPTARTGCPRMAGSAPARSWRSRRRWATRSARCPAS